MTGDGDSRPLILTELDPASFPPGDPRQVHAIVPLDPRIHSALNCGARSCPAVSVCDASQLEKQLDEAAPDFMDHEVMVEGDTLVLSEVFNWFRQDFEELPGGLATFIARHLDDGDVRRRLPERDFAAVAYRPYDWRLPTPLTKPLTARA